jgi:fatty acid desaturase
MRLAADSDYHIFHDARLKPVGWRDLVRPGRVEIVFELLLLCAWLGASLSTAYYRLYPLALIFSFMFFLTGLRIVHNAFHRALGLPRAANELVLWVMSWIMLGSLHAVRYNHLRHHRLLMGEGDVEGRSASMPAWRALLFGPAFTVLLHTTALRKGTLQLRFKVVTQILMSGIWISWVFGMSDSRVLQYHVATMLTAHCFTAFFAVWTVHHHCDRTHYLARTLRNRVKNAITFDMFRHIEHHLFPAVPTCHLARLSERLDRATPELRKNLVF